MPVPRPSPNGYLVWIVAVAVLAAWELSTLFGHPRSAHPTISSISDSLLAYHPVRWLLFAAWAFAFPGLCLSLYAAVTYVPLARRALAEGRVGSTP